eukprot:g990.t1
MQQQEDHSVWWNEAEKVLGGPLKVLTQEQRHFYFQNGYLKVENAVSDEWLQRLRSVTESFIEEARVTVKPGDPAKKFIVEESHSPDNPRLIRLQNPIRRDDVYKQFALDGPVTDIAEDLLGPSVRFHHCKLNFKWHSGGDAVAWHQDCQFWPHSNYSPVTIGCYLEDVDMQMGPLGVVPGSHLGPLYKLRDGQGVWTGIVSPEDLAGANLEKATYLPGKAGTITVHNSRMIHGSLPNNHPTKMRPLLLQTFTAGNAVPVNAGSNTMGGTFSEIVRGTDPSELVFDPRPCPMPPDFSKTGYKPTFFSGQKHNFDASKATSTDEMGNANTNTDDRLGRANL